MNIVFRRQKVLFGIINRQFEILERKPCIGRLNQPIHLPRLGSLRSGYPTDIEPQTFSYERMPMCDVRHTTVITYSSDCNLESHVQESPELSEPNNANDGQLHYIRDPLARVTTFVYDGTGRLTSVEFPESEQTDKMYLVGFQGEGASWRPRQETYQFGSNPKNPFYPIDPLED